MKKKVLSMLTALIMVLALLPATVFAEEATTIDLSASAYTIETDGAYTVSAYTGANTLTIKADATVTLNGVNITAAADASAISIESGNVTLIVAADSALTGGDNGAGIYVAEGASVTIKGAGKLTAVGNAGADDTFGAAGIGGTWTNGNSGAITIDGATVVAKGYGVHGSGVGSGSGKVVGEIKVINGANVTAYGGYYADGVGTTLQSNYGKSDPEGGAAIGGGGKTASTIANITISDSTVVAYGGSKAAGIGANFWSGCGTITISGNSNVTAQGGSSSAGIGTSREGDNGVTANIVISGGTVKATGGAYGAGIGRGYNNDSLGNGADASALPEVSITISGGSVTATGGEGGAGIGGGYKGDNVDIDITGGTVTAAAGALVNGKTVANGGAASAIGTGANGSGTFENSPEVMIGENATVNATAHNGGKPAVEKYVAAIGSTKFYSLQAAIDAAAANDTVTVFAGKYTENATVNKAITVVGETDSDGNNLVNITGNISVGNGATVKNLNVHNDKTGQYDCAMDVNGKDIVIDGVKLTGYNAMRYCYTTGDVTIKNSTINGNNFTVHFDGKAGANITFENCDITGWCSYASTVSSVSYTSCKLDNGSYDGHRYYNKNISFTNCEFSEGMMIDLESSSSTVSIVDENGTMSEKSAKALFTDPYYVWKSNVTLNGKKLTYAASMGGKYYDTLQEAIDAIPEGSATYWVYLKSDNELTAPVTIPENKKAVVDTNGYSITCAEGVAAFEIGNTDTKIEAPAGLLVTTTVPRADVVYEDGAYFVKPWPESNATIGHGFQTIVNESKPRESITTTLENVYVRESLVLKIYSGDTLLGITTLRDYEDGDTSKPLYPASGSYTVNNVISGVESGSWETEWVVELSQKNIPTKMEVYADGKLTDTYEDSDGCFLSDEYKTEYIALCPPVYVVTFETKGGTAVADQEVVAGNTATEPAKPSRGGYRFFGWYSDSAYRTRFDFSTPITADITLYAKWVSAAPAPGNNTHVTSVNPFVDVDKDDYFYEAVLWAVENDVTNGVTETRFAPHQTCTRAQVVTFLWRAAGCPAPKSYDNPFTDLDEDAYYYSAVLWAVENGITNGTGNGTTFSPYETVTRGQVVTFLHRYAGSEEPDAASDFSDVPANKYYADAVAWAVENSITDGKTATTFEPNTGCTRAHIVTFLYRFLGK